jgi:hypothetical protein
MKISRLDFSTCEKKPTFYVKHHKTSGLILKSAKGLDKGPKPYSTMMVCLLLGIIIIPTQIAFSREQDSVMDEPQHLKKSIRLFLTAWLIERNIEKAETKFGKSAYANEAMFSESCAGYIKEADRKLKAAIKAGIEQFLRDGLPEKPVTSLDAALEKRSVSEMARQIRGRAMNNPEKDHFLLLKLKKNQVPVDEAWAKIYLQKNLPEDFYVSFVPIGGGLVYFLWISEDNRWAIYHASLVCM